VRRRSRQAGEQGLFGVRRGAQHKNTRHPAPRLRLARRGISPAQNPDLHAAETLTLRPVLAKYSGRSGPVTPPDT
jgi:hypothetical protein